MTDPAPSPRTPLILLAEYLEACQHRARVEGDYRKGRRVHSLVEAMTAQHMAEDALTTLDPAEIRALAAASPAPAPAEAERGTATVEVGRGFYSGDKAFILRAISEDMAVATFDYCPRAEANTLTALTPVKAEPLAGWTQLHVLGDTLYGGHPQWKSMAPIAKPVQVCGPSQRLIAVEQLHKIMGRLNEAETEFGVDLSGIWCAVAELVAPPQVASDSASASTLESEGAP